MNFYLFLFLEFQETKTQTGDDTGPAWTLEGLLKLASGGVDGVDGDENDDRRVFSLIK